MTHGPRRVVLGVLVAGLWAAASSVRAQFPWAGARALGMGGAQVAAVDDASAAWSNPAALGGLSGWHVELLAGGLVANRRDLAGTIDALTTLPFDALVRGERPDLLPQLIGDLQSLSAGDASVVFSGVAGAVVSYKGFALSVGDVPYAGIYPVLDLVHIVPGGEPDRALENNATGLDLAALSAREIRLAYGREFLGGTVSAGGAARLVFGRTYFQRCGVFDDCQDRSLSSLVKSAFEENAVDSTRFAFDLGVLAHLGIVRLGATGIALNQPNFDVIRLAGAPETVPLPRQIRGGVSVDALPFLTVAADGDLLKSDTLAPGAKSRQLSFGVEARLPVLAIRAGAYHDFQAPDGHWAISAGVGVSGPAVAVDASVLLSTKGGLNPTNPDRQDLGAAVSLRLHL